MYAKRILSKFQMQNCKNVSTQMDHNHNTSIYEESETVSYQYREAIGSLMYLALVTRPDIAYAVGVLSRFMEEPKIIHVNAVKRIMRYVKSTVNFGIYYEGAQTSNLVGFSDADYAGDCKTRRSTSGNVFVYNGGVVSWSSERQKSVALSTTESEFIAACNAVKELIWLKRLRNALVGRDDVVELNIDNQSAIRLIKNPEFHKRTKHIDVCYHFIREKFK